MNGSRRSARARRNGAHPGSDKRGSSYDRRRRREWLLQAFGDGERCACAHCGCDLDVETLTVDRVIPGSRGGTYRRENIVPACLPCNVRRGDAVLEKRA